VRVWDLQRPAGDGVDEGQGEALAVSNEGWLWWWCW
jgi:hypothetical protein